MLQDRFNDDPKYIAKGEQLKFDVGFEHTGGSSNKKRPHDVHNMSQGSLLNEHRHSRDHGSASRHDHHQKLATPERLDIGY